MKSDFLPKRDGDINSFENNFVTKLLLHAPVLQLDPGEVTESVEIINKHRDSFTEMVSNRAKSKSSSEEHTLQKGIALKEVRRISNKVRSCKAYTRTIGDDLGIIGPELPPKEFSGVKPLLRYALNGSDVSLKFKKDGCDGANIYSRRDGEAEFKLLSFTKSSPYVDNRSKLDSSKPEYREYSAVFIKDGFETGTRSDVMKVTVP